MHTPRFVWSALAVAIGVLADTAGSAQEKKPNIYTGTLNGIRIANDGERNTITVGQKVGEVFLTVTDKTKVLIAPAKEGDKPTPGTFKDLKIDLRVRAETVPGSLDMLDTILIYPKKEKPPEKDKE